MEDEFSFLCKQLHRFGNMQDLCAHHKCLTYDTKIFLGGGGAGPSISRSLTPNNPLADRFCYPLAYVISLRSQRFCS